jgi:hypothetical protein
MNEWMNGHIPFYQAIATGKEEEEEEMGKNMENGKKTKKNENE